MSNKQWPVPPLPLEFEYAHPILVADKKTNIELDHLLQEERKKRQEAEKRIDELMNERDQWLNLTALVDGTFDGRYYVDTLGVTEFHDAASGVSYFIRPTENCYLPRCSLYHQFRRSGKDMATLTDAFREGDRVQVCDSTELVNRWDPATVIGVVQGGPEGRVHVQFDANKKDHRVVAVDRLRFADPLDEETVLNGERQPVQKKLRRSARK
jgi:hypothetical protein